jgi:hypothetical protein
MTRQILVAAALVLLVQGVHAQGRPLPPRIAATLGNTLHYRTFDGGFDMLLFTRPDGRYEAKIRVKGAAPVRASGHWHLAGSQICRTQTLPAPPPGHETICEPYGAYPALGKDGTMLKGKMRLRLLAGDVTGNG